MIRSIFATFTGEMRKRPILALTIGYLVTQFVAAFTETYRLRKAEIDKMVAESLRDLDAWADEIEGMAKARSNAS